MWYDLEVKNVNSTVQASKELGRFYGETASDLGGFVECVKEVNELYDHGYSGAGNSMVRFGIALILIPEPLMVSDAIGGGIVAAGLLYNKLSPPPIFIDDIFKTIESQLTSFHDFGENLSNITLPDFSLNL